MGNRHLPAPIRQLESHDPARDRPTTVRHGRHLISGILRPARNAIP
jgi:hypothetical protein